MWTKQFSHCAYKNVHTKEILEILWSEHKWRDRNDEKISFYCLCTKQLTATATPVITTKSWSQCHKILNFDEEKKRNNLSVVQLSYFSSHLVFGPFSFSTLHHTHSFARSFGPKLASARTNTHTYAHSSQITNCIKLCL